MAPTFIKERAGHQFVQKTIRKPPTLGGSNVPRSPDDGSSTRNVPSPLRRFYLFLHCILRLVN
jgi:hypothetical protein